MIENTYNTLTKQEQRFLDDARRFQRLSTLWAAIGSLLIIFGVYLIVWHQAIFGHVDSLLAGGKIQAALTQLRFTHPETSLERTQYVLVDAAFSQYIPTLFLVLGACALGWGGLLLIYVHAQKRWLAIGKSVS